MKVKPQTSTTTVKSKHSVTASQINIKPPTKVYEPQFSLSNITCLAFNNYMEC